jgi:hypothetical protein
LSYSRKDVRHAIPAIACLSKEFRLGLPGANPRKSRCEKEGNLRDLAGSDKDEWGVIRGVGPEHPIKSHKKRMACLKALEPENVGGRYTLGKDAMVLEIQIHAGGRRIEARESTRTVSLPSVMIYHRHVMIYRGF